MAGQRDEFSKPTRRLLAHRAAHRCSNPSCNAVTSGPALEPGKFIDVGMAAHITAAVENGPRWDPLMQPAARKAATNGIWTCQRCGKLIDSDTSQHTVPLLQRWKNEAEQRAALMLVAGVSSIAPPLPLATPWLDAPDSLLSYASTALERVGRADELAELEAFLHQERVFSWWLWTGPAGVGKSRLAVELCRTASDDWHAGFLREVHQGGLGRLRPVSPTLVVVDYAAQRSAWLSDALLELTHRTTGPPVRVLVLEREATGSWWDRVQRVHRSSEYSPIASARYSFPRPLDGLTDHDLRALIQAVAAHLGTGLSSTDVEDIAEHAAHLDALASPLSALLATMDWLDANGVSAGRDEALRRLISRADEQLASQLATQVSLGRRMRLLATSVGGLSVADYTAMLDNPASEGVLPSAYEIPGEVADELLDGLRPDLLGELAVLDQIAGGGVDTAAAQVVLSLAARGAPEAYQGFVERTARDHRDHPQLVNLLNALPPGVSWARLAIDVIPLLRRSDHPLLVLIFTRLPELHTLSEDGPDDELMLTAHFRFASLVMAEEDYPRANQLFTTALIGADPAWPSYATLLNSRGVTWAELGRNELAIADYSAVVAAPGGTDEIRACALNNRADLHEAADRLADAIADRTAVLSLADTTFNRRYIALSRRARARWASGDRRGTYDDLEAILTTEDIAIEQKMATRLKRAELYLQRGRLPEAVADLHVVIGSPRNFDGVEASARRLLTEADPG